MSQPQWLHAVLYSGQVTRVAQHLALVLFHITDEKGMASLSLREIERITGWGKTTIADHLGELEYFIHVTLGKGRGKTTFEIQAAITEAVSQLRNVRQPDATADKKHSVRYRDAMPDTTPDTKPSVPEPNSTADTNIHSVRRPDTKHEMGGTIGGETNNYPQSKNHEEKKLTGEALDAAWKKVAAKTDKRTSVPKSALAARKTVGELDGSQGIKFEYGKLTVVNGALASLTEDFPGVDFNVVCNKVATEVAKLNHPSFNQAMALIRKWAQFQVDDAAKGKGPPRGGGGATPTESTAERRARRLDEISRQDSKKGGFQ